MRWSFSKIAAIKENVSIGDFLIALGLCEAGEDSASVPGLIRYLETEGSVNHYKLEGGGGVAFTTKINLVDKKVADAFFSEAILTDAFTSFPSPVTGVNILPASKGGFTSIDNSRGIAALASS